MSRPAENVIPFLTSKDRPLTILAVEDSRLERALLEMEIKEAGHHYLQAENGSEALEILTHNKNSIDVVLMDRLMPVMDGLTAVRRMKDDPSLRKIPIVMVTGATSQKDMQEGIDAGVFYYLTKPVDQGVLRSVLLAATREAIQNRTLGDELKRHRASFNLIHTCKFEFRTLDDAECLAAFAAHCFADPERVLPGLAELMVNAIEHGTYDIGYSRKTELLDNNTWRAEIERRQSEDSYKDRKAELVITRKDGGVCAIITDSGQGFDWKRYMTIDPSRAGHNHGRGIAQANAVSFDRLVYNEKGNQAVAFAHGQENLEW
jgi:CheY-like chemotaxis protein